MNGHVDEKLRALMKVQVASDVSGERTEMTAWIDTAFNGGLVIPHKQITALGLKQQSSAEAILADSSRVELETYVCFIDWFGETYETQIVGNDSECGLLGTQLLDGRRLEIDYEKKLVALT